ncbi:MAG: helix-turn-helix domain-containing protein [Bacteroidetes bacterium]|nr:helix-turn-helix domain-containing protein [Bacteroidota bacterium]
MKLSHLILQAINEFEVSLADKIVDQLFERLKQEDLTQGDEKLLTDEQLCNCLQISTSHFYKLKNKHKSNFPVYNVGKTKRYKLSEVEAFFKSKKYQSKN